jgi:monofunctional chorismate mutase
MVDIADSASRIRDLRASIDNIDAAIVYMLAERFRCTRAVGKLKAQHGLPARDPSRQCEQVHRLGHLAGSVTSLLSLQRNSWPFSLRKLFGNTSSLRGPAPKMPRLPHPLVERTTKAMANRAAFLKTRFGAYLDRDVPDEYAGLSHVGLGAPWGEFVRRNEE